jgi:hypothetical protein
MRIIESERGCFRGTYNEPDPACCEHDWRDVDSQSDNFVKCAKCQIPGERQRDGSIYWPAT